MQTSIRTDAGFTMAELLIGMTLSLVIIGTALTGFRNLAEASDGVSLNADMNVNLRSTLNLMTRDLLSAGRGIPVGGIPVPSGAGSLPIRRPSPLNNLTFPVGVTLPAVNPGDSLGPAIGDDPATPQIEGAQTDIISVLLDDPTLVLDGQPLVSVAANGTSVVVDNAVQIDTALNPDGVRPGDLIMLTNAFGSAVMMVTRTQAQTIFFDPGDPMDLNQFGAASGTILSLQASPGVYPPTTATRIQMVSYFLDDSDRARPRLMRQVNMFPPRPIGVVIENLQLSYDIVDGVTNPQNQPNAAGQPNQIRKANLFLSGRTHREWRRTNDFLRTAVGTQVSLRSLAFVDRYQ